MLLLNLLDSQENLKKKLRDEGDVKSVHLSCKDLAVICFAISETLLDAGAAMQQRLRDIAAKIATTLSSCLNAEAAEKVGRTRRRSRPRKPKGTPLLRLTPAQRQIVAALLPQLSDRLLLDTKNERSIEFSTSELTTIRKEATAAISHADNGLERNSLRHIIEKTTALQERADAADLLYQFKITLLEIDPPIWRRIQIHDCTLDDLHFLIQAAMGWENCHLHQFEIGGRRYGNPPHQSLRTRHREVRDPRIAAHRFQIGAGDSFPSPLPPESGSAGRLKCSHGFEFAARSEDRFRGE